MKEATKYPEGRLNEVFGKVYMKYCVGIPWIVLGILVVSTSLSGALRQLAWTVVWGIVILNIGYIGYRLIHYIIKSIKKGAS